MKAEKVMVSPLNKVTAYHKTASSPYLKNERILCQNSLALKVKTENYSNQVTKVQTPSGVSNGMTSFK
jgi:hypothetical protein